MNLVYGGYQHAVGETEISISREGLVSDLGRMYAIRETWSINGRLHADNVAAVNVAVYNLMYAYSVNRQDIYLNGSNHIMRSADTINGTRVVSPPHFPEGRGAENSTYRSYTLAVQGEFPYTGDSVLLSWAETLSFRGTGGPDWGYLECLNGPPQLQIFKEQTVRYVVQSGMAICVPDSTHRNDYAFYWSPPEPAWPSFEHANRRQIDYDLVPDMLGQRVTRWMYEFSANIPLVGYPNSQGITMHLS